MKARLFAGLLLSFAASGALAGGYSDFNAGIAAHNRGDWDETIRLSTAALAAPDLLSAFRVPAFLDRGDAHAAKKQWVDAIADYSAALALAPDNLEARMHRGTIYEEQRQFDAAIADYSEIIRLRPSLTMGYEGRAAIYDDAGNLDAAVADYSAAIAADPKYASAYVLRGSIYRRQHQFDKAIADQDQAIDLDSKSPQIYFERAQTYQDEGEYHHAISDNVNGLMLQPGDADGRLQLGLSLWAYGRFSDAATTFSQVVAHNPAASYGVLWLALAQAHDGVPYNAGLAKNAASLDLNKWPGPLVKLYLGKFALRDVIAAAGEDRANLKNRMCEANFYDGEWALLRGDKGTATPLLESAEDNCPHEFIERDAARAELKRLK